MMVVLDGEEQIMKLIDFNVARVFKDRGEIMKLFTKTGHLSFRPPELLTDGPVGYSYHIDCWHIGCSLYFMLSGQEPFADPNQAKMQEKILNLDYSPMKDGIWD